jgi:hypothetical protein
MSLLYFLFSTLALRIKEDKLYLCRILEEYERRDNMSDNKLNPQWEKLEKSLDKPSARLTSQNKPASSSSNSSKGANK